MTFRLAEQALENYQLGQRGETDMLTVSISATDAKHGFILGSAYIGSTDKTATSSNCQGNWWLPNCNGVGTPSDSDTSLIGKRNGVTPTEKSF